MKSILKVSPTAMQLINQSDSISRAMKHPDLVGIYKHLPNRK